MGEENEDEMTCGTSGDAMSVWVRTETTGQVD